jgi:hypothetical protein
MPMLYSGERSGHPLMCRISLSSNISSKIIDDLIVSEFWAITDNITWYRYLEVFQFSKGDYKIEGNSLIFFLRDGPDNNHWQSGTSVDLVLKLRYQMRSFLLYSPNVLIGHSI